MTRGALSWPQVLSTLGLAFGVDDERWDALASCQHPVVSFKITLSFSILLLHQLYLQGWGQRQTCDCRCSECCYSVLAQIFLLQASVSLVVLAQVYHLRVSPALCARDLMKVRARDGSSEYSVLTSLDYIVE